MTSGTGDQPTAPADAESGGTAPTAPTAPTALTAPQLKRPTTWDATWSQGDDDDDNHPDQGGGDGPADVPAPRPSDIDTERDDRTLNSPTDIELVMWDMSAAAVQPVDATVSLHADDRVAIARVAFH
jgi:hypothetical protein